MGGILLTIEYTDEYTDQYITFHDSRHYGNF